MKEHQYLTNEEMESVNGRNYYVQNKKPEQLHLADTTDFRSNTRTYTIVCPKCGSYNGDEHGYNIWPRKVTKSNSRKLEDALESGGDWLAVGFQCESCGTDYELVIAKRGALQITLEQKGFYIGDEAV